MDDFMTVGEIASKLKKATKTIYFYVEQKIIPSDLLIRVGKSIRMRSSDFEKWIESKRGI